MFDDHNIIIFYFQCNLNPVINEKPTTYLHPSYSYIIQHASKWLFDLSILK